MMSLQNSEATSNAALVPASTTIVATAGDVSGLESTPQFTEMIEDIAPICETEMNFLMKDVTEVISAAEEPMILEKNTSCYNKSARLSGFHLATRKGTRSVLTQQDQEKMEKYLCELLNKIDQGITPEMDADDLGGKWIQSTYFHSVYNIECFIFHLTPNRSLDYLDDFLEIPGYIETNGNNHVIAAKVLDATCGNGNDCWYKNLFYPHIGKPGPIFFPEAIRNILEVERHGLSLYESTCLIDLLCSFFVPIIDSLNLKTNTGQKITSSSITYQSDINFEIGYDFDHVKWSFPICVCCLFMKQTKIGLEAVSGNWIQGKSGSSPKDPLHVINLLGYETYINEQDMRPSINCLSSCININGYKMTRFLQSNLEIFNRYKIEPIECVNTVPRYQVTLKGRSEI